MALSLLLQGCTCFSDKTDFWNEMVDKRRADRAKRLDSIRKRNAAR